MCSYVETGFEAYLVPCHIRIGDIPQIKRPERNANQSHRYSVQEFFLPPYLQCAWTERPVYAVVYSVIEL
jgi:hypothetical protein